MKCSFMSFNISDKNHVLSNNYLEYVLIALSICITIDIYLPDPRNLFVPLINKVSFLIKWWRQKVYWSCPTKRETGFSLFLCGVAWAIFMSSQSSVWRLQHFSSHSINMILGNVIQTNTRNFLDTICFLLFFRTDIPSECVNVFCYNHKKQWLAKNIKLNSFISYRKNLYLTPS